jgi:hypothetical protein
MTARVAPRFSAARVCAYSHQQRHPPCRHHARGGAEIAGVRDRWRQSTAVTGSAFSTPIVAFIKGRLQPRSSGRGPRGRGNRSWPSPCRALSGCQPKVPGSWPTALSWRRTDIAGCKPLGVPQRLARGAGRFDAPADHRYGEAEKVRATRRNAQDSRIASKL